MNTATKTSAPPAKKGPSFKQRLSNAFVSLYNINKFIWRFFKEAFLPPFELKEVVRQCYETGVRSFTLISVTGFITGLIFAKQSRPSLATFGAQSWLPSLVSIAIMRALAPLVTSLIAAGKIGSSIGAELGSMRVTEQIDAMEVSAINPYKYLVISRVMATTITVPVLGLYCGFVALLGSFLNVHMHESTSFISFFEYGFETISFLDVFTSVVKSIFFGFTIGMVGCYKGFNATN